MNGVELDVLQADGHRPANAQRNQSAPRGNAQNADWVADHYFRDTSLAQELELQHITSIAFAGTIGIGLFINSGELIGLSGSVGCVVAFLGAGLIIIGIMHSLAEMASVRPFFNLLIDLPSTFVDEALGFAVGWTYWIAECASLAVLTSGAVRIADNIDPEHPISNGGRAGIIFLLWLVTVVTHALGVKFYGGFEHIIKWFKILLIISLWVLMILINRGVGGYSTEAFGKNITQYGIVPYFNPSGLYNSTLLGNESESSFGISGSTGRFLAVWQSITLAVYAFEGTGIVFLTAGEAKNPEIDLPLAAEYMYLIPILLSALTSFILGFNINYNDPGLFRPYANVQNPTFASSSPFILVMQKTNFGPSVTYLYLILFLIAAYTAGNTALYAASRTLFALAVKSDIRLLKNLFGKTSDKGAPIRAILASSLFSFLALLGLVDRTFNQPILTMSAFFTSSLACVYGSECIAYFRFYHGLCRLAKKGRLDRDSDYYKLRYYRGQWQPYCAILGFIGCLLIMIFTGWPAIYIMAYRHQLVDDTLLKPNKLLIWDILGAYAGPILFFTLFLSYKIKAWIQGRSTIRTFESSEDSYPANNSDEPQLPDNIPEQAQNIGDSPIKWYNIRKRKFWRYT